jgi:citrate-Mg2+:H+ or citrate-Ca2+:H+ symporter, CitMHS family
MLALLGLLTLLVFTVLVMTKRMIAYTAIIVVPIIVAIIGGFGPQLGDLMIEGLESVAKTAVLLLFTVLYFGIMMDSGLFDPLSNTLFHDDEFKLEIHGPDEEEAKEAMLDVFAKNGLRVELI